MSEARPLDEVRSADRQSAGRSMSDSRRTPVLPTGARTVADAFEMAAKAFPQAEAYVDGARRISFGEWHRASDSLARALIEGGLQPGGIVAIHLPSSIDYAVCLGAAMLAGAIACGLNTRLGPREIDAIVAKSRPAVLITEDATVLSPVTADRTVLRRSDLHAATSGAGLGAARPYREPSDPAVIIWTSGTTGLPKGAWFDHRNLEAAVRSAGPMSEAHDRKLSNTPFAHAGYMAKLWDQLAFANTIVIGTTPWSVNGMLEQLRNENITVAAAVPTQWAKLLQSPLLEESRPPGLRLCVTATAPAAPELVQEITRRMRSPLISRYAMTESPSISGTSEGDAPGVLYRTVGRPQIDTLVAVHDEAGNRLPDGEVGRIRVKGPCVMRGYWGEPELTSQTITDDGWLVSGDLGRIDADGNLVLVGRSGDMYIRGGYNVYPLEVENVLCEHPAVLQVAVIGAQAPVIGEIGVAFVAPRDPAHPPNLSELRAFCQTQLADYKAPDRLELIAQLPLTAMMKVDKIALRALLATLPAAAREARG
ncbi:FadD3 family acyl-CoA ligase [soil metagenome]